MHQNVTTTGARRLRTACGGAVLVAALALTGCQAMTPSAHGATTPSSSSSSSSSSTPTEPAAQLKVSPADGSSSVRPDAPVTVTASGGTLAKVTLTSADGTVVAGGLDAAGTTWTSSAPLAPRTTYTVAASARTTGGATSTTTATLRTLVPKDTAQYDLLPATSGPIGVGMPVVVQFAGLVTSKAARQQVEKRMTVTTAPAVKGAWGWLDDRQLISRPAAYWKPGTKVSVTADLAGIETRPGVWTARNATHSFTVGAAMVSTVNVQTDQMVVRRNGVVLRTIPITTGKSGFETREGIKVIISRESSVQMDAETTGLKKTDPNYYNVKVQWAMRLTWSGEFLHAAPWSVDSQGHANVSHGCTGMSTANAKWLFDQSHMGDVVQYVGSTRPLEAYNGYTMWNMSLAQWAGHSALA
jgi:lipoprotein-anchoring transpeptidase ErfK/SrfK